MAPTTTAYFSERRASEVHVLTTAESRDAFAHLAERVAHLAGRSRENKLVHVAGGPGLLGEVV